ncbi:MAG: hypothetical protein Q8P58_00245 [Candidatus Adlerbacteria bacterium]|nr:hypothetical protein [Candidatus Adlerbacteria bacterium]MDZ4226233.1 hypothetical protein [Patescibacteria group bacterium]
MDNKQKIAIGVIGVMVVVVGVVVYQLSYSTSLPNPPASEVATSSDEVPLVELPEAGEGVTLPLINPQVEAEPEGPTITTTPYSVYLGGAAAFGTSSEALMREEVSQVVIGYEWESLISSPMFDSATLPQWDPNDTNFQNIYEVYVWDLETNGYILLGEYPAGTEIQFPRDGLTGPYKFKVLGIDPVLRVCPGDRSFTWSMRFTFPGDISIVRTPITQNLLFSEKCQMR